MNTNTKCYCPYISPFDPCPPILTKCFSTPPHLYMTFQPPNLPQFSPYEALKFGTLWKPLFSDYTPNLSAGRKEAEN
ncbi:spore coat associated protein CotJA [Paenibacillus albiflavus]|uniref:Spore coat associated protein CotJA n=1 Tax=Paenibacillus albiflavus TaxID=2545760 RepID=A0A4R4E8M0_9BACL|nr:spore coat associated protein CotJA [Paenibacillus albiflavus]TCZ76144.1 spore coat associated protein CotJA [Paenibacillus albiflavus]